MSAEQAGRRLDALVAELEPHLSRARVQRLIEDGHLRVNGELSKASYRVRDGDELRGRLPPPRPPDLVPEAIELNIAHEDEALIVIDKPPGMVVHPSPGHASGTLVHALLHHCGHLSEVGGVTRPGIVHRLDRDTSGLLVAAKSDAAHAGLAAQFKEHSIDREYLTLVRGTPRAGGGTIDAPIGRHPTDRKRFSTRVSGGKEAVTHWSVERRFAAHSLLRVRLETGRTHQIRVHLASIGLPVAGDPVYGGGRRAAGLAGLRRQALHAAVLGFEHPVRGGRLRLVSPLPPDLTAAVEALDA